ncbi:hypothetical protein ACLI4Q_14675 [Natrialbaceae archaeon A-CW1-1]
MNSHGSYRYELVYTHQKPVYDHESWLIDWALEWLDCGCARLFQVHRGEYIDAIQFVIRIEVPNEEGTDEVPEIHDDLFERLERETSDPIGTRDGADVTEITVSDR